ERWLKHEPIRARRTGVFTRGRKWVRRNPSIAAMAAMLFALAVPLGMTIWKSEFVRHPVTTGIAVLPFQNLSEQREDAAAFRSERWLKHEPIRARRTGVFTRGRKWVRRNPSIAAMAAMLFALAVPLGMTIWKSEFVRHPVTTGIAVLPFQNLSEQREDAAAF